MKNNVKKTVNKKGKKTAGIVVSSVLVLTVSLGAVGTMAKLTNNFKNKEKVNIETNFNNWKSDVKAGWDNLFNKSNNKGKESTETIDQVEEINIVFGITKKCIENAHGLESIENKESFANEINKVLNSKTVYKSLYNTGGPGGEVPVYSLKKLEDLKRINVYGFDNLFYRDVNGNFYTEFTVSGEAVIFIPIDFDLTGKTWHYADPSYGYQFGDYSFTEFVIAENNNGEVFKAVFNKTPEEFASEHPDEFFINNK